MPSEGLVLVVDDDRDLRQALEMLLTLKGYRVISAVDGQDALAKAAAAVPAVVLLDMRMPVMDGWEFAAEFRRRYGRSVPIIVMTAAEDARERALEIDADGFLSKPFDPAQLIAVLETRIPARPG